MKIKFLGAAQTVTGSRTLLSFNHQKYLVDCGLFQGPKELRLRNWEPVIEDPRSISGVLLTHAHIDHSGYLPRLVKDGFSGPVYCSQATADLCNIMLLDAAHLQEEDARFANETKYSHHEPALPLFDTDDAIAALSLLRPVKLHEWNNLFDGIGFKLMRAGHILGSTFVQVQFSKGNGSRLLTFSGDLGNGRSKVIKHPETLSETDYLVLESTYGDRAQPRTDPLEELEVIIKKVISRGGTLIIPAFTVGRTQELLYLVRELQEQSRIANVPVYLDSPMAQDATELYLQHPDELVMVERKGRLEAPFSPRGYTMVQSADDSMLLCMSDEPKIVITAAGMLTGGRVLHHLKAKLPDEKSAVLFVGFQAEGTKGRLLRHGLKSIRIHHKPIFVEAEVYTIDSLSAHADSEDIMKWLSAFKRPPEMIFLNHGEPMAAQALCYRIRNELQWSARVVKLDEEFELA